MKQRSKIFIALFAFLFAFASKSQAQIEVMANYVFSQDSVAGFDESAASAGALAGAFYGKEYKVFMYRAKRDFIKQKYNLKPAPVKPTVTLFQNDLTWASRTATVGGACNNEDFEVATTQINAPSAVQGWQVQSGTNPNSCNPPIINGNSNYTVYVAPTVDPLIGTAISSYFDASTANTPSGNAFIRLNDANAGAKAVKLTKSFVVGPTNALFEYAYLPVIQDGSHACCDQAGFNIRITVTNTVSNTSTVLACPQISIAVPGAACSFTPPPGSPVFAACPNGPGWSYHNWAASAIDLTPYLGNQVTLDVVVVDCDAGGHGGYSYFDARCAPMDIVGNGSSFPAGTPSVTLPTCGALNATICAPAGVGPYSWDGPGVVAPYNVPSNSNQCYTTSTSADFTLSMNPPGSCQPINRIITVTITPAPYILASVIQPTCGGNTATISYTAAGSASVNPTIQWSTPPTSTTSSQNLGTATFSAGVGVVTVTALDPLGCRVTTTVNINPAPPQPTISVLNVTGSPSITCTTPSVTLSGSTTYTYGTLNYYWSSNSFTASTNSVTVANTNTMITLKVTDPVSNCVATATTAVFVNTVAPTVTVAPVNQNITCGPGVVATATATAINPTTNVTHAWYSPGVGVPTTGGGPTSIYNPIVGTNTYVLTNNINGCTTTSFVTVVSSGGTYPTINVTSPQNFTVGCSSKTVAAVTIIGQVPGGGAVSYTLLAPSFTGTNYTPGTTNVYSVTTPGTYTVIVKNNANLCETRLSLPIIQNINPPNIGYSVATQTLSCDVPSLNIVATSTTSGATYNWAFNSTPGNTPAYTVTVRTNTAGASVPSATVIDTYSLVVTDPNNLCTSQTTVKMYQNTRPPIPIITGAIPLTCLTNSVNLTNSSTSGILAATFFTTQAVVGYSWAGPPPQQPDTSASSYQAFTAGTYTLIAKDLNNGCKSQTTAVVGDNRNYPVIQTATQVALDCGAANGAGVKLAATVLGIPANGVTASWTTPVPTPSVNGLNTLTLTTDGIGEYKLTVMTNSNNCVSQKFIEVIPGILNGGFTSDKTTGFAPLTVNFTNTSASSNTASSTSSITTVWSFGNGTTKTTTNVATTSAVYNQPGTYTVTMFVRKGSCLDTVSNVIVVDIPSKLEVPNVFTPNGDNSNDIFFLKTANLTNITIVIYDRWGNKIYDLNTDKGNIAWDGKNQEGKEVPDGTYFYVIKATGKDGQAYDEKGNVSLYR